MYDHMLLATVDLYWPALIIYYVLEFGFYKITYCKSFIMICAGMIFPAGTCRAMETLSVLKKKRD